MGFWSDLKLHTTHHTLACIRDEYGLTYIDDHYRKHGVEEGWLIVSGWRVNHNHEVVVIYRLVSPDV